MGSERYFYKCISDMNNEHGNINQEDGDSHDRQYLAVAAHRQPQYLFQNGATVAGVVCRGGSISDLFYACQRAFSGKNSSGSCRCVLHECHDIPGSQSLVP
jgi:hypothetical protein